MDGTSESVSLGVKVNEAYKGWSAPGWVHKVTRGLLEAVDPRHLRGLQAVVLTNRQALTRDRKRAKVRWRSRKVRIVDSLGLYHHATPREGAWIELMTDSVLAGAPRWAWSFAIVRDGLFADTLYHEIGHHIHAVHAPEYRERENVADEWRNRLTRAMYRHRHPVFARLMAVAVTPFRWVRTFRRKRDQ
jgi:hypothetical protein